MKDTNDQHQVDWNQGKLFLNNYGTKHISITWPTLKMEIMNQTKSNGTTAIMILHQIEHLKTLTNKVRVDIVQTRIYINGNNMGTTDCDCRN